MDYKNIILDNINTSCDNIKNVFVHDSFELKQIDNDIPNVYDILYNGNHTGYILKIPKRSKLGRLSRFNFNIELHNCEKLKDVKHVSKLLFAKTHGKFIYSIMKKYHFPDLFTHITTVGMIVESEKIEKILTNLLKVTKSIHEKDVVHFDIKPENVIYDSKTDDVYLIDYENTITTTYASPDIARDKLSDCWGIGVTIYLSIYGEYPYENESTKELKKDLFVFNRDDSDDSYGGDDSNIGSKNVDQYKKIRDIDPKLKMVIRGLLERKKRKRLTCDAALEMLSSNKIFSL